MKGELMMDERKPRLCASLEVKPQHVKSVATHAMGRPTPPAIVTDTSSCKKHSHVQAVLHNAILKRASRVQRRDPTELQLGPYQRRTL